MRSARNHGAYSQVAFHAWVKTKAQRATKPALSEILSPAFCVLPTHQKMNVLFRVPNVKLRGAPTLKPEQRAYRDETHNFEMPRQGVSLLNDMLGFFFFAYLFFLTIECQQAR